MLRTPLVLVLLTAVAAAEPAPRGPDFDDAPPPRLVVTGVSTGSDLIEPTGDVMFGARSDTLDEASAGDVVRAAHWLWAHPAERIVLEGHTDRGPAVACNDDLAARRAERVREHLITLGTPSERIVMVVSTDTRIAPGRVVMYASTQSVERIAMGSFDHRHASRVVWIDREVSSGVARR